MPLNMQINWIKEKIKQILAAKLFIGARALNISNRMQDKYNGIKIDTRKE